MKASLLRLDIGTRLPVLVRICPDFYASPITTTTVPVRGWRLAVKDELRGAGARRYGNYFAGGGGLPLAISFSRNHLSKVLA